MMTIQFLFFSIAQIALFFWVIRIYRVTGAPAALVMLVPMFFLFYDNFMVAIGSFIGMGDTLKALSWPRFWAHWLSGYWIIIVCGSILRLADFRWAQNKFVMGSFCVLTVAIMIHEIPNFWHVELFPVCTNDLVRYTSRVGVGDSCVDPSFSIQQRDTPLAVIIANFVTIIVGGILAVRRRFPWMLIGSVAMLATAAVPALREAKLDNFGEVLIMGSIIWGIARFARPRDAIQFRTAAPVA